MKTKQLLMSAAIGTAAIFGLNSCGDKNETTTEEKVLIISAIPDSKISDQAASYQPLVDYLSKELGVKVEFSISKDYEASVARFANNEVQLVWYGGLTGVQARKKVAGSRAIAQGKADPNYVSYFIAHKSTGLEKSDTFPKEIADMTFTFGSTSSTSGRLMPTYFIQQETGMLPNKFFTKGVQFQSTGGHEATANAVAAGSVQVGALSYKQYEKMVKNKSLDPEVAKLIWITPKYADYNFSAHPSLNTTFGEGFVDKLQTALVNCKEEKALGAINRKAIIPAKNADFDGIIKVAKELNFIK